MNNKKLDKTSIVMISIFAAIVVAGAALFVLAANNPVTNVQEEPAEEIVEEETEVKYETYNELAESFKQACKMGDTETMYSLYYMDLLTKRAEESGATKEEYDSAMRSNMVSVSDYDEFEYGGEDLLTIKTPGAYVDELCFKAYGETFPYRDVDIQDCVAVRAYFPNGAFFDFMAAQIDGFWYMVI